MTHPKAPVLEGAVWLFPPSSWLVQLDSEDRQESLWRRRVQWGYLQTEKPSSVEVLGNLRSPFSISLLVLCLGRVQQLCRHIPHSLVTSLDLAIFLFPFHEVTPVFFSLFHYWNFFLLQGISSQSELWRLTSSFWVLPDASQALNATISILLLGLPVPSSTLSAYSGGREEETKWLAHFSKAIMNTRHCASQGPELANRYIQSRHGTHSTELAAQQPQHSGGICKILDADSPEA